MSMQAFQEEDLSIPLPDTEIDLAVRLTGGDLLESLTSEGDGECSGLMLPTGLFAASFCPEDLLEPIVFFTTTFLGFALLTETFAIGFLAAVFFAEDALLFAAVFLAETLFGFALLLLAAVFAEDDLLLAAVFLAGAALVLPLLAVFFAEDDLLFAAVFLVETFFGFALLTTFLAVFTTRLTRLAAEEVVLETTRLESVTCPAKRSNKSFARLRSVSICPSVLANLVNSC
ncbi:MAG: hypothetical protein AAF320_05235 [Myxococcota bacterium]